MVIIASCYPIDTKDAVSISYRYCWYDRKLLVPSDRPLMSPSYIHCLQYDMPLTTWQIGIIYTFCTTLEMDYSKCVGWWESHSYVILLVFSFSTILTLQHSRLAPKSEASKGTSVWQYTEVLISLISLSHVLFFALLVQTWPTNRF